MNKKITKIETLIQGGARVDTWRHPIIEYQEYDKYNDIGIVIVSYDGNKKHLNPNDRVYITYFYEYKRKLSIGTGLTKPFIYNHEHHTINNVKNPKYYKRDKNRCESSFDNMFKKHDPNKGDIEKWK